MTTSCLSHLECSKCGKTHDPDQVNQLCSCGAPLLARYDMKRLVRVKKDDLLKRPPSLWRYQEFLPVKKEENITTLGEGMTPIIPLKRIGARLGMKHLYLKDEGILPTGTFKCRGAAVGVSRAKELCVTTLAMPTNGNAGAAWAMYSARAGIKAYIVMPDDAPAITQKECVISGAALYLVRGLISDAGKIVGRAVEKYGWFDASTLKEPYRIEGKKTMALEIVEQFDWEVPDVIVYPTGGGVGIIGIHKSLCELQEIGWIQKKMPRLVSVQSAGCAPIVKAWQEGKSESEPWPNPTTIAFGLNVPKALGDFLILEAIYQTNGCAVATKDGEILQSQATLAAEEGVLACPEGAATLAATIHLLKQGWLKPDEKVVLLNTGTGLIYPETVKVEVPCLNPDEDLPE
ncbi:MAG TPA: threonine synthase [Dehalococcoidales bacterium]